MSRHLLSYYIVFLAILSVAVISCRITPDSTFQALAEVEKCMEAHPDSALNLLKRIPQPETLRGKAQADYGLLMTQAMDKNYIKLKSDSLIALAVGYYGSHGAYPIKQGKAFFYYGRVMLEMNRPEDAMKFFLSAKEVFDGGKEYKMMALISQEIGNLNWNQDLFDVALVNFQESYKYFDLAKDSFCLSYALRNIGRTYLSLPNRSDSISYSYYQRALKVAHQNNYSSEFIILQELGMMYRARKDYKKAESCLLQALRVDVKNVSISEVYLSLGFLYLLMENQIESEKYLKLSLGASNLYTQIDAFNTLYWLEKSRKNPWKAIDYKEKADSVSDIVHSNEVTEAVADLQKMYDKEKLQKENLQTKVKYQFVVLCFLILFFFAAYIGVIFYNKNRTNKKRIREIEQNIRDNNEDIVFYQQKIAEYEQTQNLSVCNQTEFGELNGKVILLTQQNRKLTMLLQKLGGDILADEEVEIDIKVYAFRVLVSLKEGTSQQGSINVEWNHLFTLFNFIYDGFTERLKKNYPTLTKHNISFICLLKIGFTNEEIGRVFMTTPDSVTKAKGRLKKLLNIPVKDDLEEFIRHY